MKKNIKLFWLFGKYSIKGLLQQPVSVVVLFIGKLIRFATLFFFLYYLVAHTKVLAGYSLPQSIFFFLVFNFIDTLGQLLFREVYRFKPLIISGEFDTILVKPYHPFHRILTGGVDVMDMMMLIPYIGLLITFIVILSPTINDLIVCLLLILNSMIIVTAFHILVIALGIVTTEVENTISIFRDITRLGMVPVDIYQEPLRAIITFIIPVGIMMTVPAKALFGQVTLPMYILSIIISSVLLFISLYLWDFALKKYQSWGG